MKTIRTLTAGLALAAFLAPAAFAADPTSKPQPQETAIISSMKDVMSLMSASAQKKVNDYLAAARAALKSGDDAGYERNLDEAMMLIAKELHEQPHNISSGS